MKRKSYLIIVLFFVLVCFLLSLHFTYVSEEDIEQYLMVMVGTSFDPLDERYVSSYDYTVEFQQMTFGYIPIFANIQGNVSYDGKDLGHFHFSGRSIDSGPISINKLEQTQCDSCGGPGEITFNSVDGWIFYITPIPPIVVKSIAYLRERSFD